MNASVHTETLKRPLPNVHAETARWVAVLRPVLGVRVGGYPGRQDVPGGVPRVYILQGTGTSSTGCPWPVSPWPGVPVRCLPGSVSPWLGYILAWVHLGLVHPAWVITGQGHYWALVNTGLSQYWP